MKKYRLKKDLPFAKAGAEIEKRELAIISDQPKWYWIITVGHCEHIIGNQFMDMSEWIEEYEEPQRLDMFPDDSIQKSLREIFGDKIYTEKRIRGFQSKFFNKDVCNLGEDDLYFIISYLADYLKEST